ncbi:NHL repeat-containing protein [Patulibacter minatonensis]|uniref:NHL repeat-containing protein n=1 Tax=Patulibacter minatonensis TaxID=298163 RepID=UPI0004797E08|nr:NHL repeat-containing protein [Patulibacter minatonensis]
MLPPAFPRPGVRRGARGASALVVTVLAVAAAALPSSPARAAGPPLTPSVVGEDPIGAGVFRFPQGLGIDPRNGHVFVADQYSGVVQAFDAGGAPLFTFGGRATRGEAGRLGVVGGVAVDKQGHVFVLDSENDRVQVFSADDGRYISGFGNSSTFTLKSGSDREDAGITSGGIAVQQDAPGKSVVAFVADSGGDRILRFALDPNSLQPYGAPKSTSGLGIKRPQGVGVNPKGDRLYVPDNQNHRLLVLNATTLAKIGTAGTFGSDPGEFKFPYDVAVDARTPNQAYVGDNINGRVNVFDASSLNFLGTFGGSGYRVGRFSIVRAVATNPLDPAGGVYVADTANNRIQRVSGDGVFTAAWGVAGRGPGYVTRARGVAYRADGTIAIADTFAHRAEIIAGDGTYIGMFGRISKLNGFAAPGKDTENQMTLPSGVAYDTSGALWVADTFNNRLVRFDGSGAVIATTAPGEISRPRGVAALPDGAVLATDSGGSRLVRVEPGGQVSTKRAGLNRPTAVAVGPTGKAYVAGPKLIIDDDTGARVAPPDGAQYWDDPQGLAVAGDGTLYVSEARPGTANGARVLRGTPQVNGGFSWETILTEGRGLNQVSDPANLALSPDGRTLLVADAGNSRVLRLDAPGAAPPVRQKVQVTVGGGPTQGTITSDPPGIDCGTDCSQLIGGNRTVTLTARPAENARFVGWGGECAPAGAGTVCQIAASKALSIVGTFGAVPPPPVKLTSATLSTAQWHLTRKAVRKRGSRKARPAQLATKAKLRIRLTQEARVRLQVEESRPGKTIGNGSRRRCAKVRSGAKVAAKVRCTRWALLPTSRTLRLIAGTTTADVGPRFPGRTLKPGLYRLRLTATDKQKRVVQRTTRSIRLKR